MKAFVDLNSLQTLSSFVFKENYEELMDVDYNISR